MKPTFRKSYFKRAALSAVVTAILFTGVTAVRAQEPKDRFVFPGTTALSEAGIPSPEEFLGYEPGDAFTPYHRVEAYIKAVADASPRLSIHKYGETYEGRALYYLVITSPENRARIEEIKANNLRLATGGLEVNEVNQLIESGQPVITWLSYSVHGNEPSSTEAAMQVIFRLAAGTDMEVETALGESVIIIDPTINPDGRDRYVNWYRSVKSNILNENAADYEHAEPWPGGRTNHYWFDLNRDWVWLVHPESRGRLTAYQKWLPQVHIDYHEQSHNNNYFTMPGQTPRNLNLPDDYEAWSDTFGRASGRALDANQVNYFTRESFDFFYPGYGSSFPSNLGAIGMLAEQGGGPRGARAVGTDDGYVLILRQRVFDHYITSMAVINTAAQRRQGLLRYFSNFFNPERHNSETTAYILPDDFGNGYLYDAVNILLKHGVEIERSTSDFSINDVRNYTDGMAGEREFEAGTFIVRTAQARHVLINTLMQRQMIIEDSVMYDMASWSIPLAYGLDAVWSESGFSVDSEVIHVAPEHQSGVIHPEATYGFVIDWDQRFAPNALAALWETGYRVRFAKKTFKRGEKTFSRGSLIVLLGRNQEHVTSIQSDMSRISSEHHVLIHGYDSGRSDDGIDLASASSRPIPEPHVGLIVGQGMNSYTAGQIWFLFDRWTGFGIDRIDLKLFSRLDLPDYDVLVFPGSDPMGGLAAELDSTQIDRLKSWLAAGGTLVATESSASFFTESQSGLTSVQLVSIQDTTAEESEVISSRFLTSYEARSDSSGLRRIPGSAMQVEVDRTHPLAFGLGDDLYTLKFGTEALRPSESFQTVARYYPDADHVLVSGYASQENRHTLAGNAFAGVLPVGQGKVVLLLDNTQYRMFWVGPARMMVNAVMLVPGM